WLRHKLYPAKIYCPVCKRPTKHHRITSRRVYGCDHCGHQLSPTARTLFHKSDTPLVKWFYAIYLIAQIHSRISANQLQRELDVTYKTAWRMLKEIRKRMDDGDATFAGVIETDVTDTFWTQERLE